MAFPRHQEEEEGWGIKFFTKETFLCEWEQMLHAHGKGWRLSLLLLNLRPWLHGAVLQCELVIV